MKLEAYLKRLAKYSGLEWPEWYQQFQQLQAAYLAEQVIPNAQAAADTIARKLPNLPHSHPAAEECELLELGDEDLPSKRWWRCRCGEVVLDVSAETGEIYMLSSFRILLDIGLS